MTDTEKMLKEAKKTLDESTLEEKRFEKKKDISEPMETYLTGLKRVMKL